MANGIYIIAYIFADGIPLIWQSFLSISLLYKIRESKDVAQTMLTIKPILYCVLMIFFCSMISYINNFIQIILECTHIISIHNPPFIIEFIPWLLFGIGVCCLYSYLLMQVYYSFIHSQYKMSKQSIKIHIIIIMLNVILLTLQPILYHKNTTHYAVIVLINNLMNAIGLSHLVYIFNNRLFQIVLTQQNKNQRRSLTSKVQINYPAQTKHLKIGELNRVQQELLEKVTKHGLLGSLIISVFFFMVLTLALLLVFHAFEYKIWIDIFEWFIVPIAINLITLFIWLGFSVNDKYYRKLCQRSDYLCLKLCNRLATNKIVKNRSVAIQESKSEIHVARVRARPNKSNPMKQLMYSPTTMDHHHWELLTPSLKPLSHLSDDNTVNTVKSDEDNEPQLD